MHGGASGFGQTTGGNLLSNPPPPRVSRRRISGNIRRPSKPAPRDARETRQNLPLPLWALCQPQGVRPLPPCLHPINPPIIPPHSRLDQ